MLDFAINTERCISCRHCVSDCPMNILAMNEENIPVVREGKESECIRCQHCLAVCPTAALSIFGLNPDDSLPAANYPDPDALASLIANRRSVRKFKQDGVDKALIYKLLNQAAAAPTGKNDHKVRFTLFDDPAAMERFRNEAKAALTRLVDEGKLPEQYAFLGKMLSFWNAGHDIIFRNTPHLLIASAPKTVASPEVDCTIALSTFEMLANANGLGTLWVGFLHYLFGVLPELRQHLQIPEDHVIGYFMAFGHPAVRYYRAVQRTPHEVITIA